MAKTTEGTGPKWTATHRYDDVYECSNGDRTLSHSIRGLEKAREGLEADGSDSAMKQLQHVNGKLEAIKRAGPPAEAPVDVAPADEAVPEAPGPQ